jgi:hypothetical protein
LAVEERGLEVMGPEWCSSEEGNAVCEDDSSLDDGGVTCRKGDSIGAGIATHSHCRRGDGDDDREEGDSVC